MFTPNITDWKILLYQINTISCSHGCFVIHVSTSSRRCACRISMCSSPHHARFIFFPASAFFFLLPPPVLHGHLSARSPSSNSFLHSSPHPFTRDPQPIDSIYFPSWVLIFHLPPPHPPSMADRTFSQVSLRVLLPCLSKKRVLSTEPILKCFSSKFSA